VATEALRSLPIITGVVGDVSRSRQELVAENTTLRLWSRKSVSGAVSGSPLAKETIDLVERSSREHWLGSSAASSRNRSADPTRWKSHRVR
jgi:hypothetical protein